MNININHKQVWAVVSVVASVAGMVANGKLKTFDREALKLEIKNEVLQDVLKEMKGS